MSPEILFSIIITNHNYESYLSECVDSALAQAYSSCEVIVVDDGSTDASRELLRKYEAVCKVIYKGQGGQASAMQAGYACSKGDYVLFLDADDFLYAGAIQDSYRVLRGKNAAKLHFALDIVDASGGVVGRFPKGGELLPSGLLLDDLMQNGSYICPPCSGNIFSRKVLEAILPFAETSEYRICADLYLLIRCLRFGTVLAINVPLGAYRVHGKNAYDVTQIVETDPLRLKRRFEAVENKKNLILDEYIYAGGSPEHAPVNQWYGIFGIKDLILCRKFAPDLFADEKPALRHLIFRFLNMVFRNKRSSLLDKVKALGFALMAIFPKCFLSFFEKKGF